ncbi:ABC transporter ATP-binding protein [Iodidimonas sp. SYSU 1G8]|uniref:ABC transporter ATP-binding protein n=1 Tax=Iodidimonas sp. SYSU 1G8 TaxID=3133967 RepID=UPI0031FEC204
MTELTAHGIDVSINGKPILEDIGFTVGSGGLMGLIGPNGAGKSTLIRALARLQQMVRGTVSIDGKSIADLPRKELARRIAYLPQGHTVHWPLDVYHLVALGRLPHLSPLARVSARDDAAIMSAMERADVTRFADRTVTTLSGGERARVMLARALAVETPILLADEPVASLDPFHQLQVMELLRGIAEDGRLVIAVLHDLPLAARFCRRLLLMEGGRLVADGTPEAVLAQNHLRDAYAIEGIHGAEQGEHFVLPWRRLGHNGARIG